MDPEQMNRIRRDAFARDQQVRELVKEVELLKQHSSVVNDWMPAFSKTLSDIKEVLCTENDSYKFKTASTGLVSFADIAVDVNRDYPVAEVVLQGREYASFHYILMHHSLSLKAMLLSDYKEAIQKNPKWDYEQVGLAVEMVRSSVEVSPSVGSFRVSDIEGVSFAEFMKAFMYVREFPLHELGIEPCTIVVRYR